MKLDNVKMEGELEPLLWSLNIGNKMGENTKISLQHDKDPKKSFDFVGVAELEVIKKNYLSCCSKQNCFEKATNGLSTHCFYEIIEDQPAMVVNFLCLPVCRNYVCEYGRRRQSDSIMKNIREKIRKMVFQD